MHLLCFWLRMIFEPVHMCQHLSLYVYTCIYLVISRDLKMDELKDIGIIVRDQLDKGLIKESDGKLLLKTIIKQKSTQGQGSLTPPAIQSQTEEGIEVD